MHCFLVSRFTLFVILLIVPMVNYAEPVGLDLLLEADSWGQIKWDITDENIESTDVLILSELNSEPLASSSYQFIRRSGESNEAYMWTIDKSGDWQIQVCTWDEEQETSGSCSNIITMRYVDTPWGPTPLIGQDPADETGTIQVVEGHFGHAEIQTTGTIGNEAGFVVLVGQSDSLTFTEHQRYWISPEEGRIFNLYDIEEAGDYRVQVCGFDNIREQVTLCSDPIIMRYVDTPWGPSHLSGDDPADETGTIELEEGSFGQVNLITTGNLGEAAGFVVLVGTHDILSYDDDQRYTLPTETEPSFNLYDIETSGDYRVQVCGFDNIREQTTLCSNVITMRFVDTPWGVTHLWGKDPANETGSIEAVRMSDGTFNWETTGNIGETCGFYALWSTDEALNFDQNTVFHIRPEEEDEIWIDTTEPGHYRVQICGADCFRAEPTLCSREIEWTVSLPMLINDAHTDVEEEDPSAENDYEEEDILEVESLDQDFEETNSLPARMIPSTRINSELIENAYQNPLHAEIRVIGKEGVNPTLSGMAPFTVHVTGLSSGLGIGSPITAR